LIRQQLEIVVRGTAPGMIGLPSPPLDVKPVVDDPSQNKKENEKEKESEKESELKEEEEHKQEKEEELGVKLWIDKERYEPGDPVIVHWESTDEHYNGDWIALNKINSKYSDYVTYKYIKQAEPRQDVNQGCKGQLQFETPSEFEQYHFRYFKNNSYQLKGKSNSFHVGPVIQLTITDTKDNDVFVKFVQISGKMYPNSWIAMYPKDEIDNSRYYTYDWISKAVDNKLKFHVPKVGVWEFRYFPSRQYCDVARVELEIKGKDSIQLMSNKDNEAEVIVEVGLATVDTAKDAVWVGLYFADEKDNSLWRRYKYVNNNHEKIVFKKPLHGGNYEARVFAKNNAVTVVCRSNTLAV